jgi:eukaryotic-like serine/threonine-protein kinase
MNHASILSEALHRTDESVKVLDRLIGLYPDFAPARTGKAVLLARQGKRDEAHREAREALTRSKQPVVYYQLTCVYALTMKDHPADRTEALAHFQKALQAGPQEFFSYLDKDPDLNNLRGDKEFDRLLEAAKTLHSQRQSGK